MIYMENNNQPPYCPLDKLLSAFLNANASETCLLSRSLGQRNYVFGLSVCCLVHSRQCDISGRPRVNGRAD